MLNSPTLSIFQHFHAIPLRSPLISLRSKWRLTGFSRRFTPKNPVRLHKPFGQLPRWGAKNVLPLNLTALPQWGRLRQSDAPRQFIYRAMPDQGSFSPLPLEGADERSEAGLASPCVKIPLHVANLRPFGAPPSKGRREKSGVC